MGGGGGGGGGGQEPGWKLYIRWDKETKYWDSQHGGNQENRLQFLQY